MYPQMMPGLMGMMGGYGADPRQQQRYPLFGQRSGNPMAAEGPPGGPGPDPRAPSPPDQSYDPNTVKQRNNMLNMGAMGMQMLQPRPPNQLFPPWLQIGSKRY